MPGEDIDRCAGSAPVSPSGDAGEQRRLRNALGRYPTGVAILGCRARDGRYVGLTCNSFSSVSLSPPLILWSLDKRSSMLADFLGCRHFAVNVLSAAQIDLAVRFTQRVDRFSGVDFEPGITGAPLIGGAAAHFECSTEHHHDGGDHVIIVGRVQAHRHAELEPLVYHRGAYASLKSRGSSEHCAVSVS